MTINTPNRVFVPSVSLSRVRSVSQVLLTFPSDEPERTFGEIRTEALRWLENKAKRALPRHAWDGESFDMLEVGAQPVSAVGLENGLWCGRNSDADDTVAKRSWITEVVVLRDDNGDVLFGCRLQCVALGESPPFDATIQNVVRQVANLHTAYLDGYRITSKAWRVATDDAADALVELLLDRYRQRPVIIVSLGRKDGHDGPGVIDADYLAHLTIGAAHVVTVTGAASYALTNRLGKEFSVFHQAVRTFRPGIDVNEDFPGDHPIARPNTVEEWPDGGAPAFLRFLVQRTLRNTVVGVDIHGQLPSFADIHAQALRRRRDKASERGASDTQLLQLALEENDSLNQKLREDKDVYNGLLLSADAERKQIEAERDYERAEARSLQARVIHLEAALLETGKQEDISIPRTFEGLEDWCRVYLSGKVHVMPRALRKAKKSDFENPELAYKTLLILRDQFVPMKRDGGPAQQRAYQQALAALGLEDLPCFSGPRAGEQDDEYKITYNGRLWKLDRHIRGSNSREERYGFRLYFFWDEGSQQVVVGSFPGHLSTRAT